MHKYAGWVRVRIGGFGVEGRPSQTYRSDAICPVWSPVPLRSQPLPEPTLSLSRFYNLGFRRIPYKKGRGVEVTIDRREATFMLWGTSQKVGENLDTYVSRGWSELGEY